MYDPHEDFGGCSPFMILIVVLSIGIVLTGLLIALNNAGVFR